MQNTAKQNYPGLVAFYGQKMRSAYSTMLLSPQERSSC